MSKGIRDYALSRFNQLLPQLRNMSARDFRRTIMDDIVKQFNVTVSSAATAYNHALKEARKSNAAAVATLGRTAGAGNGAPAANKPAAPAPAPAPAPVAAQPAPAPSEPAPAAPVISPDMVTIVKARSGEVVAVGVRRGFAQKFVDSVSGQGRGNAKLKIAENQAT